MAIYRQIQTLYWQDGFVAELTPEEKYFYFYLLTNPRTTQCGIFEINIRIMEAETGYNRETLEKLIKRFEEYRKIIYCKETREIMIVNWIKYNFINSRNTMLCINKELKEVKNKSFVNMLYKICLNRGYDVEIVFQGVSLDLEAGKKELEGSVEITGGSCERDFEGTVKIVEDSYERDFEDTVENFERDFKSTVEIAENNYEKSFKENLETTQHSYSKEEFNEEKDNSLNNMKFEGIYRGLEGAYIPLGEEEIKEKQKESSNKEKVIDNNKKKPSPKKILHVFNKNIRQATIRDTEKIALWLKNFEEEVIIQAILQAVKYDAAHIGYVESIMKNWTTLGLFTMEKLEAYRNKVSKEKDSNRCNSQAYRYLD